MAVTIHVNGTSNSLVHKGSMGIAKNTLPDVCKTPSPGGPIPIPYPIIISMSSDLVKGTKTVKVDGGNMAAIKGSQFSRCTGDEPGTAGGVKSSTNMKEATWITSSPDVKMEGKNVCRLSDKMQMNHGNTVCLAGEVQIPVASAPPPPPCPYCGRMSHDETYRRSKAERKKALLRDADDPNADLSPQARDSIKESNGNNVPAGYEVSHEVPLYTEEKKDRCKLDKADNMKTQPKSTHRARHKRSGDQYHAFPR